MAVFSVSVETEIYEDEGEQERNDGVPLIRIAGLLRDRLVPLDQLV
jgi:hypothetical protein